MNTVLQSVNWRLVALYAGLYLLTTGVSWTIFTFLAGGPQVISPVALEERRGRIDPSAPKTETCPLNGGKFTKAEREIWEKRRPLTVMIENHEEARLQSGLTSADVVYEAVAEGGITRLLAVFYCGAAATDLIIGPVRSARVYFMDWASEYGDFPLYTHVGGANRPGPADALGKIAQYGWLSQGNDLNQFAIGFPTFWRDYERIGHPVATEHTMYASTDKLWEVARERGLTEKNNEGARWDSNFVSFKFGETSGGTSATTVEFPFWQGQPNYEVRWLWEATGNVWKRENGAKAHTGLNNKEQIQVSNVVIQFVSERSLGDAEKHMLYGTIGKGEALVFRNGAVEEATWKKGERQSRTEFVDKKGNQIEFIPGKIWIEALPIGTEVNY